MSGTLRAALPSPPTGHVIRDSALGLVAETLEPILAVQELLWSGRPLRPAWVELLRLRSAHAVNCVICKAVRYDIARRDGLTEAKVRELVAPDATGALSAEERLVVAFAEAYLSQPPRLGAQLQADLARSFSGEQLQHMALAMAFFNPLSRCAVSLGGMPESYPVTEISVPAR
jgi:alkylhydroperoxidase family enzyme